MLKALIRTMRPRQWVKNAVIFAALVFDRQLRLDNLPAVLRTFAGFVIFCVLSGVVYIINDIADVEADRQHPDKRNRPIASGALPVRVALAAAIGLIVILFPLAYLLSPAFALVALAYFPAQPGLLEMDQAHPLAGCVGDCPGLCAAGCGRHHPDPRRQVFSRGCIL